jgi:sec-independent protein translocase protein TatB
MFNVGPEKLMVVLLVALIVLGPDKLPNAARQIGRYLNDFRRISQGFQQELRSAIDMAADPVTTLSQPTPTNPDPTPDLVSTPDPSVETGILPASDGVDAIVDDLATTARPATTTAGDAALPAQLEPIVEPIAEPVVEPAAEPVAEPNHTASA